MKTTYFFILITFFLKSLGGIKPGAVTPAQMALVDLKKVRAYYEANPAISMDTYYMAFNDHQTLQPAEAKYGTYMRTSNSVYTKILHVETISSADMTINIDHHDKLIVIGDNQVSQDIFPRNLDSLLIHNTSVSFKNLPGNERKYSFDFTDSNFGEYDKIELTIDTKNFTLTKMTLYFSAAMNLSGDYEGEDKKPRMEILYKNYRKTISNPALLDRNTYVTEKNGKLLAIGKYKTYELSDLRNKTRFKDKGQKTNGK